MALEHVRVVLDDENLFCPLLTILSSSIGWEDACREARSHAKCVRTSFPEPHPVCGSLMKAALCYTSLR